MIDPNEALQQILQPSGLKNTFFPPRSRYYNIETSTLERADGGKITYIRRRFCPSPESFAFLQEHVVVQGDRLDNIAARYVGDPEQFWRICDANNVMRPDELTETIGKKVRITLPEGIPGVVNA